MLGFGGVGVVAANLAAARLRVANLDVFYTGGGEDGEQSVNQFLHGGLGAGGDLEDLAPHALDGGREPHGSYEVANVDEVARLGAVAVDLEHLVARRPLYEPRDDAVLVPRERPVDVPEAQNHRVYAEGAVVG